MGSDRAALSLLALVVVLLNACQPVMPIEAGPAPSQSKVPERILFVGTCITDDNGGLDKHLDAMVASDMPQLQVETASVTVCSTPLPGVWQNARVQNKIQEGDWDVIVLQGSLSMGDDPEEYEETVCKFDELIHDVGGRTVLFMNWQRDYRGEMAEDYPQIEEIARVTEHTGAMINADVAPVGLAWERALAENPDLALYQIDRTHGTIQATYLTAAVLYATIFDHSPVGLSYRPADLLPDPSSLGPEQKLIVQPMYDFYQMSDDEAEFLQRIAWDTVQEYQAAE